MTASLEDIKKKAFSEDDRAKLVELLNFISENAKFEMDVKGVIKFHGLLSWAQQSLLKKINDNIMGEAKVIVPEKEPKPTSKKKK